MTEIPLTEQDKLDLALLAAEPTQRSLLAVWAAVLEDIDTVAARPIPVTVASKVVASWPFLTFQETALYHQDFHQILGSLRSVLRDYLRENPDATSFVGDEDAQENHKIYLDVLVDWHMALDSLEENWRAEHPHSHIRVAAIADARAFFFAQTGLAGHLDAIGFSLSNDEFLDAVRAVREVQGE